MLFLMQLKYMELQTHRIMEWFELERTSNIIYFQAPCCGQGHLPLGQVGQYPIQPHLEQFQG